MYVLKSSVNGEVSLGNYWSVNQNVKAGDIIMTIVPNKVEKPFGQLFLNIENSGKVKKGQQVNIKLSNFPPIEFGILKGEVKNISLAPDNDKYFVEIALTKGLETNYKKQLPFIKEMSGTAEIITDDMRLIERLIAPIRLIIKKKL